MNHKLLTTFSSFVLLTLLCCLQITRAQNNEDKIVNKFIANQAKHEKAVEYKEARKVLRSDLNRDGKDEVVVLYTLESFGGTNLWVQYLAIFTNRSNKIIYAAHRSVGRKNERILELQSVAKGQINFDTKEYLRQDASCCPSGKGHARFTFNNGNLKEIKSKSRQPVTTANSQEIKSTNRYPMIEIWQELDGSVAIRGKSLHFRLYDDGVVELEYELCKETEPGKQRYIFSIERVPPAKLSEEKFNDFKSVFEELIKSKNIKSEYQTVELIFDVTVKLTILLRENEITTREIIINSSNLDVVNSKFEKEFPNLLRNLFKEVQLMRVDLQEKRVCRKRS
jgi:hypothetical protein